MSKNIEIEGIILEIHLLGQNGLMAPAPSV